MDAERALCRDENRRNARETSHHLDTGVRSKRYTGKVSVAGAEETLIPIKEWLGEEHREEGSQHKEGTKGNILITLDDA